MAAYSPAEIHRLFEHAFNLGDVEALVALYEPNAVLVVAGQDVIGRESIREALQNLLPRRGLMTLKRVLSSYRRKVWRCCTAAGRSNLQREWEPKSRLGGSALRWFVNSKTERGFSLSIIRTRRSN